MSKIDSVVVYNINKLLFIILADELVKTKPGTVKILFWMSTGARFTYYLINLKSLNKIKSQSFLK